LLLGSGDFKQTAKGGISKNSLNYSSRESSYAGRYQIWTDLKGRVRRLDGPFSPTMFEGDYLTLKKHWVEKKLQKNGFGADHCYSIGRKIFNNVDCHVLVSEKENENKLQSKVLKKLREEGICIQDYNKAIKTLQKRVEEPFEFAKTKFKSLGKKWAESEEQHAKVIKFALAVYNSTISSE
jgi:hypothetical protein